MTLAEFPRISVDPAICGGRPTIADTRVRVADILDMLAGGASEGEIVADFPYLKPTDVRAVLMFAARSSDHVVISATAG